MPGGAREAEHGLGLIYGALFGILLCILAIGAQVFEQHDRSMSVVVYAIGFVIAGLCLVVPWIAKSIEGSVVDHNV